MNLEEKVEQSWQSFKIFVFWKIIPTFCSFPYSYIWIFFVLQVGRIAEPQGARETHRQLMKNERRGLYPKSKVMSKWAEIGDTSLNGLDLKKLNQRMFGYNNHHLTHLATSLVKIGIVVATSFPPTFHHLQLIVECAKRYSSKDLTIRDSERNILADFSPASISKAFRIPSHVRTVTKKKEQTLRIYTSRIQFYEEIIKKRWLKKNRSHLSKIPKEPVWLDL